MQEDSNTHEADAAPDPGLLALICDLAGPPPAAIAQLGSGTGSYVAALCALGYDCRGVEPLRALHLEALARHPHLSGERLSTQSSSLNVLGSARLINADMTEVFDMLRPPLALVFCLGARLMELDDRADLGDVLLQLCDLTRPAGKVLVEMPQGMDIEEDFGAILASVLDEQVRSGRLKEVQLDWLDSDTGSALGLITLQSRA